MNMTARYLADPLQQLTHAYKSYMRRAIQKAGIALPITHVRVLRGIAHIPNCTALGLSVLMRRDKAQITRVLNDLLDAALIIKHDNPQDRRSQLLELSPAGQAILQQVMALDSQATQRMSEGLQPEQMNTFIQLARHMADKLNDIQENSMSRPTPRTLQVLASQPVTPHMLRITLGGAQIDQFPADQESAYIKLIFPVADSDKNLMRTYTVRHHRADQFDVDFVLHEDAGPASQWAKDAKPGDQILIGGPGPKKLVDNSADWFLIVGDMTALPAISVNLEQLPADARGHALIEVIAESDIQPLRHPAGVELHWLINPHPGEDSELLVERVRGLDWPAGRPSVWAACEFNAMRALRKHFKEERQVERKDLYISSYWKLGSSEDQHKAAKREDAEAQGE
ncbi:SIP domain-containing protein [Pseudomonas sp. LRF_L74]|uniref:SIP domain-containing protein n=1 Tax=Pseudomonas sp. LRF_L74 TaxID=3369422 RepID=UPI003F5E88EF